MARQLRPLDLVPNLVREGLAQNLEVDGPQFFRNYPVVDSTELSATREALEASGLRLTIIGGYMDRFFDSSKKVSDELLMRKLQSQLALAKTLGGYGLRLQFDALQEQEMDQALDWAEKYNIKILLELQGSATPNTASTSKIIEGLQSRNHPMLRILLDASLFMRSFPSTYKSFLTRLGLSNLQISGLEKSWIGLEASEFRTLVTNQISDGKLPRALLGQLPTLTARFGHSRASDWQGIEGFLDCLHLKYWDDDDSSGALSEVAAEALSLYDLANFPGYIVSEWGGHDWMSVEQASGLEMSKKHKDVVLEKINKLTTSSQEA